MAKQTDKVIKTKKTATKKVVKKEKTIKAETKKTATKKVAEKKEQKKFAGSRVDEAYYYYKKAMHEGENYDVEKATLHSLEDAVEGFDPVIAEKQKILEAVSLDNKVKTIESIISFYLYETGINNQTIQ